MGKIRIAKLRWNDGERLPTGLPEFVEYPATLAKKLIDRHFTSPEPKFVTIDRLKEFGISSEPVKTSEQIEAERQAELAKIKAEQEKEAEYERVMAENARLKAEVDRKNKGISEEQLEYAMSLAKKEEEAQMATKTDTIEKKPRKVKESKTK